MRNLFKYGGWSDNSGGGGEKGGILAKTGLYKSQMEAQGQSSWAECSEEPDSGLVKEKVFVTQALF